MNILQKCLFILGAQTKKIDVRFPRNDVQVKILDVDLSKTGGNIDENIDADLRSTDKPKRKRRKIPTRTD